MAASARLAAKISTVSVAYLQQLRDAAAMKLFKRQRDFLKGLAPASSAQLQITLDETEVPAVVDGQLGLFHLCMLHAVLFWTLRDSGVTKVFQIVMAPAFLLNTGAEFLLSAIRRRLPVSLRELKHLVKRFSVNIGSEVDN